MQNLIYLKCGVVRISALVILIFAACLNAKQTVLPDNHNTVDDGLSVVTKPHQNGPSPSIGCPNATSNHRVEIEFTTKIIQNEYIVTFDGYYKSTAREAYVRAALNGSKVSNRNCVFGASYFMD